MFCPVFLSGDLEMAVPGDCKEVEGLEKGGEGIHHHLQLPEGESNT